MLCVYIYRRENQNKERHQEKSIYIISIILINQRKRQSIALNFRYTLNPI